MTDVAFSWFSRMSGVRVLRVLIISTLGVGAYALPGPASAGCEGNATASLSGSYGWASAICVGEDGNEDARGGSTGTLIDYDITSDTQLDVDDSAEDPHWGEPVHGLPGGVLTLYSGGGVGYEEGGGGAGGEINVTNSGEIRLEGGSESFSTASSRHNQSAAAAIRITATTIPMAAPVVTVAISISPMTASW